jgi:hypothetical protein
MNSGYASTGTSMTVHALRIYRNDLLGIFGPLASAWRGHIFANDFAVTINAKGEVEDPLPGLRAQYGSALLAADVKNQFALLGGDDFCRWGKAVSSCQGALLPIFRDAPSFASLTQLYYGRDFRLTSETWPTKMRALLQLWDGRYWQIFTTEQADVDALIRAHAGDPKFKLYRVDLKREYPDPSNQELEVALPPGVTVDA